MPRKPKPRRKAKKKPEKRPGPGAPPTITYDLIKHIAELVKHGNYIETAYAAVGVPKSDFYEWMTKGRLRKGTIYAALTEAVDQAMAEGETRDVLNIDRAALGAKAEFLREKGEDGVERVVYDENGKPVVLRPGSKPDWKASAWRLERRNPNRWGRSVVQLEIPLGDPKPKGDDEETVGVDPYSIKATLEKIRNEY